MADKLAKLIHDALRKSAADRAGLPLTGSRQEPGLFPANAAGKAAAEKACSDGLLSRVCDADVWTLTDAGFKRLLDESNPRQVLEDCVRAIEARQQQLESLRATISRTHASLDGLRATVERVLPGLDRDESPDAAIEEALANWDADASEDCPLPDLYRQLSGVSLGEFHDALRRLHAAERVYLHPWTGPLYAIPEPACALLVGHEIAYYVSGRATAPREAESQYAQVG